MPATSGAAVIVEQLSKSYGDTVAVRDVSFEVQRGEVFALLGPNGAGKTTTVEILEGFRDRSGGRVETLGVDPAERSTQRWLRTHIGVVLQELAIEPYYSVRQVLSRNAGFYPNPRPVDEVIELIGLGEKADDRVKRLSGGQQRRLDVGLGIIGNPSLLFLDEPTTGLDPSGRRDTWQLIHRLAESGTTVLLTTHYMDEVEVLGGPGGRPLRPGDRGHGDAVLHRRPRRGRRHHPFRAPRGRLARRVAGSGCPHRGGRGRGRVRRRGRREGRDQDGGRGGGAAPVDRLGARGRVPAARDLGRSRLTRGRLPGLTRDGEAVER